MYDVGCINVALAISHSFLSFFQKRIERDELVAEAVFNSLPQRVGV